MYVRLSFFMSLKHTVGRWSNLSSLYQYVSSTLSGFQIGACMGIENRLHVAPRRMFFLLSTLPCLASPICSMVSPHSFFSQMPLCFSLSFLCLFVWLPGCPSFVFSFCRSGRVSVDTSLSLPPSLPLFLICLSWLSSQILLPISLHHVICLSLSLSISCCERII